MRSPVWRSRRSVPIFRPCIRCGRGPWARWRPSRASRRRPPSRRESVNIATEDYGCVLLRFAGGARGCLWVSQVTAGRKNCLRYEIAGSNEALAWCSEQPNEMWIGHRDKANESLIRDPVAARRQGPAVHQLSRRPQRGLPGHLQAVLPGVLRLHQGGGPRARPRRSPPSPTVIGRFVLCEAILQSHREGRWVPVKGERQ